MSKRRRSARRRTRKSPRALFDRIYATLHTDAPHDPNAISSERSLSPFSKPLAQIADIVAPFAQGPIQATNRRSGAYYLSGLLNRPDDILPQSARNASQDSQKRMPILEELPATPFASLELDKDDTLSDPPVRSKRKVRGKKQSVKRETHLDSIAAYSLLESPALTRNEKTDARINIPNNEPPVLETRRGATGETFFTPSLFSASPINMPFLPAEMGLLAWTQDPATANHLVSLSGDTIYLTMIHLHTRSTIKQLYAYLLALKKIRHPMHLCCGLYAPDNSLIARSENIALIPPMYHRPAPPYSLTFSSPQILPPGTYVLALHNKNRSRDIRLCAATAYRGHALLVQSNCYRSAQSRVKHSVLPEKINWDEFQPGHNYWFGVS